MTLFWQLPEWNTIRWCTLMPTEIREGRIKEIPFVFFISAFPTRTGTYFQHKCKISQLYSTYFNFLVKFELFRSGTVCTVCLDNPREVVLQGCGHVCVCGDCASRSGFPHYRNYLLYASAWWSFFFLVVDRAATKQFIHVCSSLCLSILKICQGNGSSTRRVCPALSRCFIFQDPVGGQPLPCLPARDW